MLQLTVCPFGNMVVEKCNQKPSTSMGEIHEEKKDGGMVYNGNSNFFFLPKVRDTKFKRNDLDIQSNES